MTGVAGQSLIVLQATVYKLSHQPKPYDHLNWLHTSGQG